MQDRDLAERPLLAQLAGDLVRAARPRARPTPRTRGPVTSPASEWSRTVPTNTQVPPAPCVGDERQGLVDARSARTCASTRVVGDACDGSDTPPIVTRRGRTMAGMSDMPSGFGFGSGTIPTRSRDAPLFRELQRVMSSSSGPVNWELARQVGDRERGRRPATTPSRPTRIDRGFEEAVRVAELHVARFTGSKRRPTSRRSGRCAAPSGSTPTPRASETCWSPPPRMARRWRATAMMRLQDGPEMAMGSMFGQLSPLLMGAQVGHGARGSSRST